MLGARKEEKRKGQQEKIAMIIDSIGGVSGPLSRGALGGYVYSLSFSRSVGLWGSRALAGIMPLVFLFQPTFHIEQHGRPKDNCSNLKYYTLRITANVALTKRRQNLVDASQDKKLEKGRFPEAT